MAVPMSSSGRRTSVWAARVRSTLELADGRTLRAFSRKKPVPGDTVSVTIASAWRR